MPTQNPPPPQGWGSSPGRSSWGQRPPPRRGGCGCALLNAARWPSAEIRITNHSSKVSNYWVDVEFLDAKGERISEGFAATSNLAPDRVANETATGTREATGTVTCRVTDVTRYASP
ncbi:FxLYD domain-containing protein [Streptomyces sp. NPDC055099]